MEGKNSRVKRDSRGHIVRKDRSERLLKIQQTRTQMLRDDGKRLGLHPRGQAGRREDGGTTGGRRDDGRTVGRREDGGRRATAPQLRWVHTGDSGTRGRERMMLLAKCTRRCVKEEEGSGGESIYIHDPRADLGAARHTTRHTSENHRYNKWFDCQTKELVTRRTSEKALQLKKDVKVVALAEKSTTLERIMEIDSESEYELLLD